MFRFLLKGIYRDRSRSIFPVIVCAAGVFMVFFGSCFLEGTMENFISANANLSTGHVKVVSYAYGQEKGSASLELAMELEEGFLDKLNTEYPQFRWTKRTNFGGLLDIPDEKGETRAQSPASCLAIDLISPNSVEAKELNLEKALQEGRLPKEKNEILLSANLAKRLGAKLGERVTILTSTVDGATTAGNFIIVGFIRLGIPMLDRSTAIVDVAGADYLLDMEDYASEIYGLAHNGFDRGLIEKTAKKFNGQVKSRDQYRPYMLTMMQQNNTEAMLSKMNLAISFVSFLFVFLMTLVLWNAGLISGIRRFSEVGVRLAIGERRRHIILSMLFESIITGVIGTILGILLALPLVYYVQEVGIDYSHSFKDFSMMMSGVMRTKITTKSFVNACVPGVLASFLGMLMASWAIYQRKTASLFKELET